MIYQAPSYSLDALGRFRWNSKEQCRLYPSVANLRAFAEQGELANDNWSSAEIEQSDRSRDEESGNAATDLRREFSFEF